MKELLEYLVKLIVKKPENVGVAEEDAPDWTNLKLTVAPEDMGLVIGKGGKIISALRHLVRIRAIKDNKRINVELMEAPKDPA